MDKSDAVVKTLQGGEKHVVNVDVLMWQPSQLSGYWRLICTKSL